MNIIFYKLLIKKMFACLHFEIVQQLCIVCRLVNNIILFKNFGILFTKHFIRMNYDIQLNYRLLIHILYYFI